MSPRALPLTEEQKTHARRLDKERKARKRARSEHNTAAPAVYVITSLALGSSDLDTLAKKYEHPVPQDYIRLETRGVVDANVFLISEALTLLIEMGVVRELGGLYSLRLWSLETLLHEGAALMLRQLLGGTQSGGHTALPRRPTRFISLEDAIAHAGADTARAKILLLVREKIRAVGTGQRFVLTEQEIRNCGTTVYQREMSRLRLIEGMDVPRREPGVPYAAIYHQDLQD